MLSHTKFYLIIDVSNFAQMELRTSTVSAEIVWNHVQLAEMMFKNVRLACRVHQKSTITKTLAMRSVLKELFSMSNRVSAILAKNSAASIAPFKIQMTALCSKLIKHALNVTQAS